QTDCKSSQMREPGRQSIAMIDNNQVAISGFPPGDFHNSARGRFNWRADGSIDVESQMHFRSGFKGVGAAPKPACNLAADGPDIRRCRIHDQPLIHQLIEELVLAFEAFYAVPK